MSDEVRVGFIGCGGNARGHMKRVAQLPGATIAAVCDLAEEAATKALMKGDFKSGEAAVYYGQAALKGSGGFLFLPFGFLIRFCYDQFAPALLKVEPNRL